MSDAIARFTHDLLSYAPGTHAVIAAADAAPEDATLNAYAAAAALFAMAPAARAHADPYLRRAAATAASRDDHLLVSAITAWHRGDLPRAIALHRARLALRPDDRAASKICQLHHLDMGDFAGMVATIRLTLPHHPDDHFVLGQLAFALEEADAGEEARALAPRAVALAQATGVDDPWSIHALMHVHHRAGRLAESIALVHAHAALWERSGTFMSIHAWWHAAIALLDLDRPDAALALYDERLAPVDAACVQSLVARVSLLARLRLREVDVGQRWAALVAALEDHAADGVNGFLDIHYVYGLALAGEAERARAAAARLAGLTRETATALIAAADGCPQAAAPRLAALAPALPRLGGSHEQRELYELVELDAAVAARRFDHAAALLARGRATRPAWQRRLLATVMAAREGRELSA